MFKNRGKAAELLLEKLESYRKKTDTVVVGIPRGGVVLAKILSDILKLPLEILVIKKIGARENPELAIGALAPDGVAYWDEKLVKELGVGEEERKKLLRVKEKEREEKERVLGALPPSLDKKTVIVVDDGVATGATTVAAALYFKKQKVKQAILATPVIGTDTLHIIKKYYNKVVYLLSPNNFQAVGQFYQEFPQVSDEEVISLLASRKNEEHD